MDSSEANKAKPKPGSAGGSAGPQAPAKGESSASDISPEKEPASPKSDLNTLEGSLTFADPSPSPSTGRPRQSSTSSRYQLQPGDVFGGRYEIVKVLGEGGMGTVYKAHDREVDHFVALKLIRPDMASHSTILARFKQELLTARQVTHRNVIRIYELSEIDGVKFITMEFVEGCDLHQLLREKGKLSPEQSVEIIRQVCLALEAAHGAGVIHRDLKPQNIMQDNHGRVLVMDFGLARSLESDGMTRTGTLLGTMEYMSPEQAMGKHLDARSDLFTVGLIFYELLTGNTPFKADTAMASLLKRNQERAIPVIDVDGSVPKALSDIVGRCLERDLELRYQNVQEVLADLDAWQGKRPVMASVMSSRPQRAVPWKWVAAGAIAAAIAAGGWELRVKLSSVAPAKVARGPDVSLAILPFHNRTTDSSLDWLGPSIADMLNTDVGRSARMRIVSSDRLNQILQDLRVPAASDLDPETVKRIAELSNADTVVSGQYAKFGSQIRIDATLLDLKRDRSAHLNIGANNENEIPASIDGLAELIRKNLSVSEDVLKELKASSFQPSSKSAAALRSYNEGLVLARQGNYLEAAKRFETSVQADAAFALAYSRLGLTYGNLRNDEKARDYSRKAVELSESLPAAERYLIQANNAQVSNDYRKAIESYENLEKASPDDTDIHFHLGELYESTGTYDKARAELGQALASDPKHVQALIAAGRVEIRSGNPQGALDFLNRGLTLAIQFGNDDGKATILNAIGATYEQLKKPEDAMHNYQESLSIKRRLNQKPGIALTLGNIARVQAALGKPEEANKSYLEAERLQRETGDKKGLAFTLLSLGQQQNDRSRYDEALKDFKEALQIQRDLGNENIQGVCLNNIGNVYLAKGQPSDALTYYERALELRKKANVPSQVGETLHNLGEASLKAGDYSQSLDYHLKALDLFRSSGDKNGAAIQSYSMGTIFEYQGRYGAALKSKGEALTIFRELQDRSFWMGEILSGHGNSLSQVGRYDEAQKDLTEAMALARELQNKTLIAQILNFQGDTFYYRGDLKQAAVLFSQAEAASSSPDVEKDVALLSKYNVEKCAQEMKHSQSQIVSLRALVQAADGAGLKYISTEARLLLGDALLAAHKYADAKRELEIAQNTSEKLGLQALLARSQYSLGRTLELSGGGSNEAAPHYAAAKHALDNIRQESGSDAILRRKDLAAISGQS